MSVTDVTNRDVIAQPQATNGLLAGSPMISAIPQIMKAQTDALYRAVGTRRSYCWPSPTLAPTATLTTADTGAIFSVDDDAGGTDYNAQFPIYVPHLHNRLTVWLGLGVSDPTTKWIFSFYLSTFLAAQTQRMGDWSLARPGGHFPSMWANQGSGAGDPINYPMTCPPLVMDLDQHTIDAADKIVLLQFKGAWQLPMGSEWINTTVTRYAKIHSMSYQTTMVL